MGHLFFLVNYCLIYRGTVKLPTDNVFIQGKPDVLNVRPLEKTS